MNHITPALVAAALTFVSPKLPRDEWARVAMAIKSEFPDSTGLDLFDKWSQGDADGYDLKAVQSTWRSVKAGGGVGIGTLLHLAQQNGFELPKPEAAAPPPTPAQLAEQERERAARRQQEQARQDAAHARAADRAAAMWAEAGDTGSSPYLARKGVQPHGVRFAADGWLLVPLRDGEGRLWNVQTVAPERPADGAPEKLFIKGGRKSGLWCMLGTPDDAAVILVAEGYATAASLFEATGRPVAVAFDAGNLVHVCKALRGLYPDALIVVAGDDDTATAARTGSNPGRDKATAAARAVKGLAVFPAPLPEGASDFNDLHQSAGLDAVRALIEGAINDHATRQAARHSPGPPRGQHDDAAGGPADPFVVTDEGVYFQGFDRDGRPNNPLWLCSALHVTARTRDSDGQAWGYLLSFNDPTGRPREWAMPARMLAGDGGEYRSILYSMGLRINSAPTARNKLTEYLQTRQPEALAVCTDRTGWHATAEGGAAYVLPRETIGDGAERIVFQSDAQMENTFRQRGDVAAWRDRVGALCAGNSRLVFAVACAFAGPLMRPGGVDSGGFHFRGDSSSGKTTALRVAASVNGAPGYMQRWRTTDNALEIIAAQHCDALLILDELAQVEGRVAGECAYMLANEQSKGRATRGSAPRARLTWRLLFLSAGELGLADHMAEAMKRARVGQEVRMVDMSSDAGAGMGLFESLHDRDGPAALANELTRNAATTYGAPGREWLVWLAGRWQGLGKRLRERTDALRAAWVPEGASGQVERVAARFALVAVAGELATEAGLTGWPARESERAARLCFESWLDQRGGAGNAEVRQMLRQVRRFFELHGEGRFTWWHRAADDHNAKTLQRAGFRRMVTPDGTPISRDTQHAAEIGERMPSELGEHMQTEYFVLPETFRTEVCQGFDPQAVCRVLADHDCLAAEGGRYTVKPRLPGMGPTRCYHIKPELMGLEV
ncbi:DUF927 domain-containing protein [Ottowia sp.]|uniref:DUF927 domain-containing protein n=1 Tax=Ottowia sp. TaxID=1898956 RepID=UPI002C8FCD19|nr:DUF927 domain-containing protein [Ottowia sp.]HRN76528.1 DUF927 domain-containing protein [Ottowia sp.]HRQ03704.1 DUF927 domain-containing protein [Ottowia sp.]